MDAAFASLDKLTFFMSERQSLLSKNPPYLSIADGFEQIVFSTPNLFLKRGGSTSREPWLESLFGSSTTCLIQGLDFQNHVADLGCEFEV